MHIIEASNLTKVYETGSIKVNALRGVDLSIEKGEMVAVMGPSGCGKTTLLNCLSGIDDVTKGSVIIEGKELTSLDDDAKTLLRARRMGFVFQFYNLLPILNAVENVELPLLLAGVKDDEARHRAEGTLEQVGLGGKGGQRPASLSGGERQRVTIARALVNDPAIIWADEPTGDLDRNTATNIMDLMRRLNRENGQTFVIVTHDAEIGDMCDRTILMQDGEVIDHGKGE